MGSNGENINEIAECWAPQSVPRQLAAKRKTSPTVVEIFLFFIIGVPFLTMVIPIVIIFGGMIVVFILAIVFALIAAFLSFYASCFVHAGAADYSSKMAFARHVSYIFIPAMLSSALMGVLVLFVSPRTRRDRISFFPESGIGIGKSSNPLEQRTLYWSNLKDVRIERDIFALRPEYRLKLAIKNSNETLTIKWKHVTDCVEPGSFINAVRTYAPEAAKQLELPALAGAKPKAVSADSYTQLWFKYHSKGKERKRATELGADDVLNERYRVVRRVGGGGQGTAYLAVGPDQQEILLKEYILPLHRGNQVLQDTVEKLEREAAILRSIQHRQIVGLTDCFTEDHRGYLVMEFIEGKTLKELVDSEGPQPEAVVRGLALQACEIVSYLHAMDPPVIHRDLTPDNFILQENGMLKLVDFNVAHQLESAATATVVGKHCYIPPEQFRGKPTIQSDIYALGGTLHFLLTGQEPEPITVSHPKSIVASVSDDVSQIVARATTLDVTKRYASVAELAQELQQAKTTHA